MGKKYNIKIPSFHKQGRDVYAIVGDDEVVGFEKHWQKGDSLNIVRYKTRRMVIKISKMPKITQEQYGLYARKMFSDHIGGLYTGLKLKKLEAEVIENNE